MPFLSDSDAQRAEDLDAGVPAAELVKWIERLLEDRKARIALEQRLCRRIVYLRKRLNDATK